MALPYHSAVRSRGYHRDVAGYPARRYHPILSRPERVSIDEQHVALPTLYGAPAYARPAPVVATSPRPFDPDDLPIEAFQTEDERALVEELPAHAWAPGGSHRSSASGDGSGPSDTARGLRPIPLRLRAIAGRLLGGD